MGARQEPDEGEPPPCAVCAVQASHFGVTFLMVTALHMPIASVLCLF